MTINDANTPNYGRRITWLAVFVIVVVAAYCAGWFYLANGVVKRAKETIADLNRDGVQVECDNPVARGFPFRLGIYCDKVAYARTADEVALTAGNLRTAGQIYDPMFFIAELDGPATVTTPGSGLLNLDWQKLRASVRWARPMPERVSLEGGLLAASTASGTPLATIGSFEAHMRPNGQDLDLATSFDEMVIDPALAQGRTLPVLSGEYDLTVNEGVGLRGLEPQDLRGHSGVIRDASLNIGPRGGFSVTGPFSVGDDGLLSAELKVTVRDPQSLSAVLEQAFPEKRREIRNVASALTFMGSSPTLPLVIQNGTAKIAFFELGNIPPL